MKSKCEKCGCELSESRIIATEMETREVYEFCDLVCFNEFANMADLGMCHIELED